MARQSDFDKMIAQADADIEAMQRWRQWVIDAKNKRSAPKPRREKAAKGKAAKPATEVQS